MLLEEFGEDVVLAGKLVLEGTDPLVPGVSSLARGGEGGGAVLEELLRPQVKERHRQVMFTAEVGDGFALQPVQPESRDLLLGGKRAACAFRQKNPPRKDCREFPRRHIPIPNEALHHSFGGIGSFDYNAWVPKGTIWHQEDATALLSPALFQHFLKPFDDGIVGAFDGCIMHQHSTGYVPFEHYLEMDFTALELHIDEGGPSDEELFDTHKKILEKKPLIIWGDIPERDLDWIFSKLPAWGLTMITVVDSPHQAVAI